ncbi:MAG: hypothetical protein ABI144_02895 [Gallionella sp.]
MENQKSTSMENMTDTTKLRMVQQDKLNELLAQQKNLSALQTELEKINLKIKNKEKLSEEDTEYISNLGWLAALSVTIAAIATSV